VIGVALAFGCQKLEAPKEAPPEEPTAPIKTKVDRVNAKTPKSGDGFTQFGRTMSDLDIDVICANTPAAKGRVERAHQTLQDRLVKELRLRGISAIPWTRVE
jgi:hypothetical protein